MGCSWPVPPSPGCPRPRAQQGPSAATGGAPLSLQPPCSRGAAPWPPPRTHSPSHCPPHPVVHPCGTPPVLEWVRMATHPAARGAHRVTEGHQHPESPSVGVTTAWGCIHEGMGDPPPPPWHGAPNCRGPQQCVEGHPHHCTAPPLLGTKPVGVEPGTGTGTSLHSGRYSIQALDPTWLCMGCWVLRRVLRAALGAVQCTAGCCTGCCTGYWMLYSVLGAALGAAQGAGCCIGCCTGCWVLHWVLQLGGGVQQVPQPQAGHDLCSPPGARPSPTCALNPIPAPHQPPNSEGPGRAALAPERWEGGTGGTPGPARQGP